MRRRFVFLLTLLLLAGSVLAHGPGRVVRAAFGFCDGDDGVSRVERRLRIGEQGKPATDCLRAVNLEDFPIALQLRGLAGEYDPLSQQNLCLYSTREADNGATQRFDGCRLRGVTLPAGATVDIPLEVLPGGPNVQCVLAGLRPLGVDNELPIAGLHVKSRRLFGLMTLDQPAGLSAVLPTDAADCDPLQARLLEQTRRVQAREAGELPATESTAATGVPTGNRLRHPGLPRYWQWVSLGAMLLLALWALRSRSPGVTPPPRRRLSDLPLLGALARRLTRSRWPLLLARWLSLALFLLVIVAGLFGNPRGDANLATLFTWNLWWPLVIVSVLLIGTGWCAVCPWDTLASLLARGSLTRPARWQWLKPRRVPGWLRSSWPALLLLLGFTWLEIGLDAARSPRLTALMAIAITLLALLAMLRFERKAFCRWFCPVGRTIGLYGRLAPLAVQSQDQSVCDSCQTLDCYHGNAEAAGCPTGLTIGRFAQNARCLSCGNCVYACPQDNVGWQLRPFDAEAGLLTRPALDAAWLTLVLLGITLFHGLSMTPLWDELVTRLALSLGERGGLPVSTSLGMLLLVLLPAAGYAVAVRLTRVQEPRRLFSTLAFALLPLTLAYHVAHNLAHLLNEHIDWLALAGDPLGLSFAGGICRVDPAALAGERVWLFVLQAGLLVGGFGLSLRILRLRLAEAGERGWPSRLPMLLLLLLIGAVALALLGSDMLMRFD